MVPGGGAGDDCGGATPHGGSSHQQPGVEPGNCPAGGSGGSPPEKRTTPGQVVGAVTFHAGTVAASVPSNSARAGGGTKAHQPRAAWSATRCEEHPSELKHPCNP